MNRICLLSLENQDNKTFGIYFVYFVRERQKVAWIEVGLSPNNDVKLKCKMAGPRDR